jgi:hypothetical protein
MDGKTLLLVGAIAVGVYTVYLMNGKSLPSLSSDYLAPTKRPDYPSPTETVEYDTVPASQTPTVPDVNDSGACTISSREEFNAWGRGGQVGDNVSDDDFNTILTGAKARAGCFSPPT